MAEVICSRCLTLVRYQQALDGGPTWLMVNADGSLHQKTCVPVPVPRPHKPKPYGAFLPGMADLAKVPERGEGGVGG